MQEALTNRQLFISAIAKLALLHKRWRLKKKLALLQKKEKPTKELQDTRKESSISTELHMMVQDSKWQ